MYILTTKLTLLYIPTPHYVTLRQEVFVSQIALLYCIYGGSFYTKYLIRVLSSFLSVCLLTCRKTETLVRLVFEVSNLKP